MTLPHPAITKIPVNERTPANPATFNTRYAEVDENFTNHETRLSNNETEVKNARGGKNNLNERLVEMNNSISGLDPDMQNMLVSSIMQALSAAGTANKEIRKTIEQRFQTGIATIRNRGIISGCTATKSSTATRNCSMAAGRVFVGGRIIPIDAESNGAAIPGNSGGAAAYCYLYLGKASSGKYEMFCTALGDETPEGGIPLYKVTVPAGNVEATDQYIANCTLTDVRRMEAGAPAIFTTAPYIYVALPYSMLNTDYAIDVDIMDFTGCGFQLGYVYASDRAANGFKLCLNGVADDVKCRWTARKLEL
ncbi:MAG: hypothetical protein Q4D58_07960 [Synergistaceae bacterium]|nr:hypothetical protein [Synergistaceae bacterium]